MHRRSSNLPYRQPAVAFARHQSISLHAISGLGGVVILRFTTVQRTFSSLRCSYSRHSGESRNDGEYDHKD